MESQDSSQETQPEVPEPENTSRPTRDLLAQLIPLHPTADYVDLVTVPFSFGRLKSSNFVINDKRISATHCIFTKKGDHIYIEDKSTNGTYINQYMLGKGNSMKLKTGDIVAFVEKDGYGTFSYVFYDVCAPPSTSDKVFKEYIVECVLGNGNFGVVQRIKRISTGELFAMKVIDKMKLVATYNKMDENNTLMEVHILKILRHPNLNKGIALTVTIHHCCGGSLRYTTLCLPHFGVCRADQGELFEKIFNQGCYSEPEGKKVFRQILDAIAYLHDNKIAHRDLKPENILLHNNNGELVVKVSDFGLAKILGEFQSTKTLCGTPMYVAPEMLAHSRFLQGDKTVDPEAKNGYGIEVDAWSLGCILYIILSGRPPFNDPIPKDLFERIAAGDYEMTDDPWPRISSDAKDLISKLLVVDPAKRLTVRGALEHNWFCELSDKPLYSNIDKPKNNKPSKPDKSDKSDKSDNNSDKLDKHNVANEKNNDNNESYRTSVKPQKQNSSNIENMENMKHSNERRNSDTHKADNTEKHKESNSNTNNGTDHEGDINKNNKRGSFKEITRDKTKETNNGKEESRKMERTPSERTSSRGGSGRLERHSRSLNETTDYSNVARIENRNDKTKDNSHRQHKPNEVEPISSSKETSKSPVQDSKDGKKETKSVHSIFALPTTPSTKSSPHKSPKKHSFERPPNTRKLEFTRSPSAETKTSMPQKDAPVVAVIEKPSKDKEKHTPKRFLLSSQSRRLELVAPAPKPRTGSLVVGSSDDEAKKRKLAQGKGDSLVVIEDDESRTFFPKKQREF